MNGKEIVAILTNDSQSRRIFRGVYARDELPHTVCYCPSVYVINTDHSRGRGLHWVVVYIGLHNEVEYFDSFGIPPTHPSINDFILRNTLQPLRFNTRLIQNIISIRCGEFCCYYVLMKSRGASMSRIVQVFDTDNLRLNDRRVQKLLQRFIVV